MSGNNLNYIGHNQWNGLDFQNFYERVISGNYDKVILFCQNEWAHHHHNPEYFPFLQEHMKKIDKPLHIITASHSHLYPIKLDNTQVHWWDTYWIGKTYGYLLHTNAGNKISIDPYEKIDYKYHYISMNNRPHVHRCLLIDLLARHDLLKHGAISLHNSPHPDLYQWKYFDYRPMLLDKQYPNEKNQNILPEQYYDSFAQLISEASGDTIMMSEKTSIALLLGKPFLAATQMHFHKFIKGLGFELYDEIFDYSFDDEPEQEKRYEMLLENFKRLCQIPLGTLPQLQERIANKIAFNKKHAKTLIFDTSTYPALGLEIINHYKDTGNVIDKHLIDDYENWTMYKDCEI